MRAVHLVTLTRNGQEGSPSPLTVPQWGFYSSLFRNRRFSMPVPYGETIIHRTIVKLIACEGHALTATEAALQLSHIVPGKAPDLVQSIEKSIHGLTCLP